MRIFLFLAIVANSADLIVTSLGVHWFGNGEGNPLLSGMMRHRWWLFVGVKGLLIPALIVSLYLWRRRSPWLSAAGLAIVTVAMTVAVGQWIGWMAGVMRVSHLMNF